MSEQGEWAIVTARGESGVAVFRVLEEHVRSDNGQVRARGGRRRAGGVRLVRAAANRLGRVLSRRTRCRGRAPGGEPQSFSGVPPRPCPSPPPGRTAGSRGSPSPPGCSARACWAAHHRSRSASLLVRDRPTVDPLAQVWRWWQLSTCRSIAPRCPPSSVADRTASSSTRPTAQRPLTYTWNATKRSPNSGSAQFGCRTAVGSAGLNFCVRRVWFVRMWKPC